MDGIDVAAPQGGNAERSTPHSAAGELVFHVFGAIAHFGASADRRADEERDRGGAGAR